MNYNREIIFLIDNIDETEATNKYKSYPDSVMSEYNDERRLNEIQAFYDDKRWDVDYKGTIIQPREYTIVHETRDEAFGDRVPTRKNINDIIIDINAYYERHPSTVIVIGGKCPDDYSKIGEKYIEIAYSPPMDKFQVCGDKDIHYFFNMLSFVSVITFPIFLLTPLVPFSFLAAAASTAKLVGISSCYDYNSFRDEISYLELSYDCAKITAIGETDMAIAEIS
jgi:hypothetical protein